MIRHMLLPMTAIFLMAHLGWSQASSPSQADPATQLCAALDHEAVRPQPRLSGTATCKSKSVGLPGMPTTTPGFRGDFEVFRSSNDGVLIRSSSTLPAFEILSTPNDCVTRLTSRGRQVDVQEFANDVTALLRFGSLADEIRNGLKPSLSPKSTSSNRHWTLELPKEFIPSPERSLAPS